MNRRGYRRTCDGAAHGGSDAHAGLEAGPSGPAASVGLLGATMSPVAFVHRSLRRPVASLNHLVKGPVHSVDSAAEWAGSAGPTAEVPHIRTGLSL
jgi:hypothetical protein